MAQQDWIWLIDDDEQLSDILSLTLESEGYEVHCSRSADHVSSLLDTPDQVRRFSLVLLDLKLAEQDGLTLLPRIREEMPDVPIFVITAHGDVDSAVQAFTLGANGYIRKPFQDGEIKSRIAQAIDQYHLRTDLQSRRVPSIHNDVYTMIRTRDPAMETVLRKISMAANVSSNVVISGESGTGKELVARALHRLGPRREGPFVAFNCAALPETLMESELFGHVRGAFTDARESKPGLFQRASGGTLFLDEIGDAPLSIQAKLLRVLQEKEVLPLGATTPVKVDVRVVSATHRSLKEEVEQKRFRADLFYRLHVLSIHLPPLRERPKDILYLASIFGEKLAREMGFTFGGFTRQAVSEMEDYGWPGNVRELQNRIEQAIALGGGGVISRKNLFPERPMEEDALESPLLEPSLDEGLPSFNEAKISFERNYLEKVLSAAKGNIAKAARLASKSRTEVYGLLKKHGLNPGLFKNASVTRPAPGQPLENMIDGQNNK